MSLLDSDMEFQELLETGKLYRQIFDCSVLPIIIHDMYLNIVDVNDKTLEVFGYSKEELLEMQVLDLHAESELKHSVEVLEEMQQQDSLTVQSQFKRKDGSIFSAEASPCKINLKRTAFIHVHLQNIKDCES